MTRPARPTRLRYDNRAEPPASVTVTIRYSRLGIMPPQCTWTCTGCLDGDDQPQALKWARAAALIHARHCDIPAHTRYTDRRNLP